MPGRKKTKIQNTGNGNPLMKNGGLNMYTAGGIIGGAINQNYISMSPSRGNQNDEAQ
jgi:hypothetical protein